MKEFQVLECMHAYFRPGGVHIDIPKGLLSDIFYLLSNLILD